MSPSPLAPATDRWGDRLPRRLGFWSAVAVLVGSTIGGGIFRTPAVIAERVPAPLPMFGVWVLGGLLALCGALTYAELAALFPRSGGVYVYIREGFGRLPAFLFGWTELVLIRASALGAISTPFSEYLLRSIGRDPALPENAGLVHYVAAAAIAVTAALNYYGVRWSAFVLNLTTGAKYGALLLLVLLAFFVGHGDWTHFTSAAGPVTPGLFGLALVSVLWAYDGWGDLSFVGGEVRDPERNLPRALVMGTAAIIAIYLLVNAAYLYLLPLGQMAGSPLVAADAAPPASRPAAAGSRARVSGGAAAVRAGELPHSRERAVGAPAGDWVCVPHYPVGRAGLLLVDSPAHVGSDANVTLARIDDLSGGRHV